MAAPNVKIRGDGRVDLTWADVTVAVEGLGPQVTYRSNATAVTWRPRRLAREGDTTTATRGGLVLTLKGEARGDAVVLSAVVRNDRPDSVRLDALAPLAVGPDGAVVVGPRVADWSVYRNGFQSWSGTGTLRRGDRDHEPPIGLLSMTTVNAAHPAPRRRGAYRSELVTAISSGTEGPALCAGFLDEAAMFGGFDIDCGRTLVGACDLDGIELGPGEEIESAPLLLSAGRDGTALLEAWAAQLGEDMHARVPARAPTGWCSWYYYFTKVDEDAVVDNLDALARLKADVPCDYVMVDDGHQSDIGDWLDTNSKFPSGMAALAGRIRDAGFDAGIWTAPFLAGARSRLFREHPNWFVRTDRGKARVGIVNPAWGTPGTCYALDTTHPDALAWLESVAATLVHEWGYHILKLDFLYAAALPGQRHDTRATRAEALRRGLEAVRSGAGEDAFLLGCGCPLGPAVGIVDAMRIGADVAPYWTNAALRSRWGGGDRHGPASKNAVRNTLTRAFMHRRLWLNDPDCLMVRTDRTRLTEAEVRTLAGVFGVTDGMLVLSDRVDTIPTDRLRLLRRAHDLLGGEARVVDLFGADMPETVVAARGRDILVAVANLTDAPRARSLDVGRFGVPDGPADEVLCGGTVTVAGGRVDLGELGPHDCRVISARKAPLMRGQA